MLGALAYALERTGLLSWLRAAWLHDVREEHKRLRAEGGPAQQKETARLAHEVARLASAVARLEAQVADQEARQRKAERQAARAALVVKLDEEQRDLLGRLPEVLDPPRIRAHVTAAIDAATLIDDPFPHLVVSGVLPEDAYRLVRRAIPPTAFFGDADPVKQNLRIPIDRGPALATRVWHFVDREVAHEAIVPAVTRRFADHLEQHYTALFGADFVAAAAALTQAPSGGRVMLRRPGYRLAPHRDPKRAMLTCLMYLARAGDDEGFGTDLYRVHDEHESSYAQTYYPEEAGSPCELVARVPYRPNSMLVFLNGRGAHGASIPSDAPRDLERFAYQFYVGPDADELAALVARLPEARQSAWRDKSEAGPAAG